MTTAVADAKRRVKEPLIEGTKMVCPRCRRKYDILAFKRLEMPVEYEDHLTPVYKCPRTAVDASGKHGCGYLFAPAESAIKESMTL